MKRKKDTWKPGSGDDDIQEQKKTETVTAEVFKSRIVHLEVVGGFGGRGNSQIISTMKREEGERRREGNVNKQTGKIGTCTLLRSCDSQNRTIRSC